jgi:hypothetical protein
MKKTLFASAAAAALTLSLSAPAFADCAAEIAALQAPQATGSIGTSGTAPADDQAAATADQASTEADASTNEQQITADAEAETSGEATGGAPTDEQAMTGDVEAGEAVAGEVPQTEATPAMNAAVGDRAASVQDVIAQDAGEPTAAQQAMQAEEAPDQTASAQTAETTATAGYTVGGNEVDMMAVLVARAQAYQNLGNEEACMNVIEQAKTLTQ